MSAPAVPTDVAQRVARLLRDDLRGQTAYGAPQLDVPVRLNTNENSYAVPPDVVAAITAAVAGCASDLNRYPDREFTALREDLAAWLTEQTGVGVEAAQVWAGNGSNEVLQHVVQAFAGPGRVALGFTPAYSMHPIISRTMGSTWVDGHRGGADGPFDLTEGDVVAQVLAAAPHVVFLCSPNNPTGTALDLEIVRAVLDAAPDAVVVVDDAYDWAISWPHPRWSTRCASCGCPTTFPRRRRRSPGPPWRTARACWPRSWPSRTSAIASWKPLQHKASRPCLAMPTSSCSVGWPTLAAPGRRCSPTVCSSAMSGSPTTFG